MVQGQSLQLSRHLDSGNRVGEVERGSVFPDVGGDVDGAVLKSMVGFIHTAVMKSIELFWRYINIIQLNRTAV